MLWRVISYDDFNLATDDYFAILHEGDNPNILPTITAVVVKLGDMPPTIDGVTREMDQLVVTVSVGNRNADTLTRNLIQKFSNATKDTKTMVVEEQVSGVRWNLQARPNNILRKKGRMFKAIMDVPDRIWRKTATPITWSITSSPATQNVPNAGNSKSYPVLTWTPSNQKATGFQYRHFVTVLNPGDVAYDNYGLNLTANGLDTRPWVADTSISNQINLGGGINASQTTIPIDTAVGGGLPEFGMGMVDSEQIAWTSKPGGTQLAGVTRGVGGTTAATHADNAVIKISYMLANGNDLRAYVDGVEDNLWVRSPNTATTKMWLTLSKLAPRIELELRTDVAATGDVEKIEFDKSYLGKKAFARLPASGMILLDSEIFTYYGKNDRDLTVGVVERKAKDTAEAAHTAGITCYFVEHDIWLYSGNPYASAQVTDDALKPIIDLDDSTNLIRKWYLFGDRTNLRANSWIYVVERTRNPDATAGQGSMTYTGNHGEDADPYTEAGLRMTSVYMDRWLAETGKITVAIYEPAGISTMVVNGEKNKVGNSWPRTVAVQKSQTGDFWNSLYAIAAPTGAWDAISSGTLTPGTGFYHARLIIEGTVLGGNSSGSPYEASIEANDITINTVLPPSVSIGTRQLSSYEADLKLENGANGEGFEIKTTVAVGQSIVIDCAAKTVTYSGDGQERRSALVKDTSQLNFLSLEGGDNPLTYTESGVLGASLLIEYDDMLVV